MIDLCVFTSKKLQRHLNLFSLERRGLSGDPIFVYHYNNADLDQHEYFKVPRLEGRDSFN